MKVIVPDRRKVQLGVPLTIVSVTALAVLAFSLSLTLIPAQAGMAFAAPLCGDGSAPDYGFNYDQQQPHWTVDEGNYVSEQTLNEVDTVLDPLNADSIAQTMILILTKDQVGNRVNCAVHFLRYMRLGLPDGERKDNGFVFLIVLDGEKIDVHYGVGLGLPALTAPELTSLNRSAEDTYQSAHSLDQALLTLVHGFDTVARNKYPPLISSTPTPEIINMPQLPSGPLGLLAICGMVCLGILLLLFVIWLLSVMARYGISFNPGGSGSFGRGFGGGFSGGWGRGGGSSRGGGGSGRSGRGN